jgi:catalase
MLPIAGNEYPGEAEAAGRGPNFLFDEIEERVAKEAVGFRVVVQSADDGDIVDDAAVRWPEERPQLAFGEISLQEITPNNAGEQQYIIFDPIPRVDGIEASGRSSLRAASQHLSDERQAAQRPDSAKRHRLIPS